MSEPTPIKSVPSTSEPKSEFDFHLTGPLRYAYQGDQVDASFVRFFAPSSKVSRECAALKQAFMRAVPKNQDDAGAGAETPDKEPQISGSDVITVLAMSPDVDLPDLLDVGRRLFLAPGVAMVDGETKLTKNLLDNLSQDDFESMVGDYMANFTLASQFAKMKGD